MLSPEALVRTKREVAKQNDLPEDQVYTCDECPENETCDYRFDLYNTNGDCLASK